MTEIPLTHHSGASRAEKRLDSASAPFPFVHPNGAIPKTVHLVCTGFSKDAYYAALSQYEPKIPKGDEIWTINKTTRHQKADLIFMLDDLVGEFNRAPVYVHEVMRASIHTPVITTTLDQNAIKLLRDHIPGVAADDQINWHEYPIYSVRTFLGVSFAAMFQLRTDTPQAYDNATVKQMGNDLVYFRNSVPMILAYALAIGVEQIYIWGADYDHPVSGVRLEDDKPNCEYWVGFCRGRGMNVIVPRQSTLCKQQFGHWSKWIYGYGARQPDLIRG